MRVNRAVVLPPYMQSTPLFPQLRAQLAALGRRTFESLHQLDLLALAEQFRDLFPPQLLACADEGSGSRERIYSLRLTFQCFVWQMFKPRTSCREVVRAVQCLFQSQGWGTVDERTSAYIQARQRLPEDRLEQALASTAQVADRRVGDQGYLQGRPVKVADSSTTQLSDTPENQALYPQAPGQKPGCGFPLLKFLPLFSLSSGAISHVVTAHWKTHDTRLLRQAWELLQKGDVLLVDRAFGDYVTLATLLDPVQYPAAELIALYRRRWQMELTLRHLKTTMGMEQLRCQSPAMVQKELLAYLVAYNLIRCLMAEAVAQAGIEWERLSFKGTVDAVRTYTAEIRAARSRTKREHLWEELSRAIVADKVPHRPGRTEPRAVKRRPKAYPLLNKPRHQFIEIPHRHRYRKNKAA